MIYTEIIKYLQTYAKIYESVGAGQKYKEDIKAEWSESKLKPSDSTIKTHLDKAFKGVLPLLKIQDNQASIDKLELRNFVEEFCTALGVDASILFTEPMPIVKGRRGKDIPIPVIEGVESPIVKKLKKGMLEQKTNFAKKEQSYLGHLSLKDEEIKRLKQQVKDGVVKGIITEMDKNVVVLSSIESRPKELFQQDFFLDRYEGVVKHPESLSKDGGERKSFYHSITDSKLALTTEVYCKKVAQILFGSRFFENRNKDMENLLDHHKVEEAVYENRKQSIRMILQDQNMSNQMKLTLYAGWHEYHGTEMEDLLNFAGDHCIDANYVISLLEHPQSLNNYQNIRGFLRQACKASEVRMKREAARELIAGDWYVIAEYNGKPCRFQMVPMSELIKFRKALLSNQNNDEVTTLEELIVTKREAFFEGEDPDKDIIVKDVKDKGVDKENCFKDASAMIHEMEKGYEQDIHAVIDEEKIMDDFIEREI